MATSWTPLVLVPTEHPKAPDFSYQSSSNTQKQMPTAFSSPVPNSLASKYLKSSNFGHTYAVYLLADLGESNKDVLIQTIRRNQNYDSWRSSISLAAKSDFSNGTFREIHDHHLRFLDKFPHTNIAPSKFIVVSHSDWACNGVFIVDLHCQASHNKGGVGIVRTSVYTLTGSLMLLEASAHYWDDLKKKELQTTWPSPIAGDTGSHQEHLDVSKT